jgi:hypothetical protein
MKKILALIVILAVVITGYFAAGPFITIYKIKSGIKNRDAEKISAQVDYSALRTNLKEQFNALLMKKTASDLKDNSFAALGMAFASKLIDGMVDAYVTPTNLANLMEGKKSEQPKGIEETTKENSNKPEPFKDARYTYDGFSKFSAWVKGDKDEEIRFVFTRNGLSWKLSNIQVPSNVFEGDKSVSANSQSTEEQTTSSQKVSEPSAFMVVLLEKKFIPADYENRILDAIKITIALTNLTGKDIRAFDGVLGFTDLLDNEIYSAPVAINKRIAANATLEWSGGIDCNRYIDSHQRLKNEDFENLKVYFKTRKILFSDGTTKEFLND